MLQRNFSKLIVSGYLLSLLVVFFLNPTIDSSRSPASGLEPIITLASVGGTDADYKAKLQQFVDRIEFPPGQDWRSIWNQKLQLYFQAVDKGAIADGAGFTELQKRVIEFGSAPGNVSKVTYGHVPSSLSAGRWQPATKILEMDGFAFHLKGDRMVRTILHELSHGYFISIGQGSNSRYLATDIITVLDRELLAYTVAWGSPKLGYEMLRDTSAYGKKLIFFDAIFPKFKQLEIPQKMRAINRIADLAASNPGLFAEVQSLLSGNFFSPNLLYSTWQPVDSALMAKLQPILDEVFMVPKELLLASIPEYAGAISKPGGVAGAYLNNYIPDMVKSSLGTSGLERLEGSAKLEIRALGGDVPLADVTGMVPRSIGDQELIRRALNSPGRLIDSGNIASNGSSVLMSVDETELYKMFGAGKAVTGSKAIQIFEGFNAEQAAAKAADETRGVFVGQVRVGAEAGLHRSGFDRSKVTLGGSTSGTNLSGETSVTVERIGVSIPKEWADAEKLLRVYESEVASGYIPTGDGKALYEGLKDIQKDVKLNVNPDWKIEIENRASLNQRLNSEVAIYGNVRRYSGEFDYLTGASKNNVFSRAGMYARETAGVAGKGLEVVAILGPVFEGFGAFIGTAQGGGDFKDANREMGNVIIDGQLNFAEDLLTMVIRVGRMDSDFSKSVSRKLARVHIDGLVEYSIGVRYALFKMLYGKTSNVPAPRYMEQLSFNNDKLNLWQKFIGKDTLGFLYAASGFGLTDYVNRRMSWVLPENSPEINIDSYLSRLKETSGFQFWDQYFDIQNKFYSRSQSGFSPSEDPQANEWEQLVLGIGSHIRMHLNLDQGFHDAVGYSAQSKQNLYKAYELLFPREMLPPEEWDPGSYEYRYGQDSVFINGSPFTIDYATGVMSGGGR